MPPVIAGIAIAIGTALGAAGTELAFLVGMQVLMGIGKALLGFAATALTGALSPKQPKLRTGSEMRVSVRDPDAVRELVLGRIRKGGTIVFMTTTDNRNHLHIMLVLAGHKCSAVREVYFNDELAFDSAGVVQKKFKDFAFISKHLGDDNQTADTDLINRVSEWTSNHRLRGLTYLYVRLIYNTDKFPSVPNISAVTDGALVFDPRDGLTKFTDNAALSTAGYLNHNLYGPAIPYSNTRGIDPNALSASANLCDESVAIPNSGTEKRYTLNGVVRSDQTPQAIIEGLLTSMAGTLNYVGGKWYVTPGSFTASVIELDENDLRGTLEIQTQLSKREVANAIRGQFISSNDKYTPRGFPPLTSTAFEAEDNNERIWRDIELPYTVTETMAERLARIELFSTREQISVSSVWGLKALKAKVGDTVGLTNTRMGWSNKPFRVTHWKLAMREQEQAPELVVEMDLRETSSAVYDVTAGDQQLLAAAPDTNLPTPTTLAGGTIFTLPSQPGALILGHQVVLPGMAQIVEKEQSSAWLGTKVGLIKNPLTGHLVVDDQTGASGNNFDVFDKFVQLPVVSSSYESPAVALAFEDEVRITASFLARAGPGENGSFAPKVQYDFKTDLGAFDGFADIGPNGVETAILKEFKFKILFTAGGGGGFILEEFGPQAWKEALLQSARDVTVDIGGRTVVYEQEYHNKPNLDVSAVDAAARVAVITAQSRTQFSSKVFNPVTGGDVGGAINYRSEGV